MSHTDALAFVKVILPLVFIIIGVTAFVILVRREAGQKTQPGLWTFDERNLVDIALFLITFVFLLTGLAFFLPQVGIDPPYLSRGL